MYCCDCVCSGGGKKLLKYLDKLTSHKYFQQATEYKYIKKAMETVSNTPLQLQVSVKHLVGKLAINIPPPPSDRLW
jgi:disulfide oxidoreductase YuzD